MLTGILKITPWSNFIYAIVIYCRCGYSIYPKLIKKHFTAQSTSEKAAHCSPTSLSSNNQTPILKIDIEALLVPNIVSASMELGQIL